jgi:regulator of protease activity HflC (stomatin/prohibitin superfamily)
MKIINYISIAVVVLLVGSWVALHMATISIPIGTVGVRTQEYGLKNKGVIEEDFGPGWHRRLGGIDTWNLFDSTVQTLEMTKDPRQGDLKSQDDVRVQSADGYAVSVDVTVKFRIQEGMAHKVYQNTGGGDEYKRVVRNEAQEACMGLFGQMKTEDFYNSEIRRKKADEVQLRLAESLEDNYIEAIDVLIRDVAFDPEYESKIRLKKLADQEVELNKSMAEAAKMKGKTEVTEAETGRLVKVIGEEKKAAIITMQAETDLTIAKISAEANRYAEEKKADADLIKAQREADGDLLVKTAEADGERLRNKALVGSGGGTMVALEAARNLKLSDISVSTLQIDFLDIDGMVNKLGLGEGLP